MMKYLIHLLLLGSLLISCEQKEQSKEVLFVCKHGAARSPIAAAYFNRLAEEKGLNYHAVFRGTEPDEALTTETVIGLSDDQFEIADWKPSKVSAQDMSNAFKIVTFDLVLPSDDPSLSQEQWNRTPSISKDYEAARNAIRQKVEALVNSL